MHANNSQAFLGAQDAAEVLVMARLAALTIQTTSSAVRLSAGLARTSFHVQCHAVQGCTWDFKVHHALVDQLQAAVDRIHAAGVVHNALDPCNIRVTPDDNVIVLDFKKASLKSPSSLHYAEELQHEQNCLADLARLARSYKVMYL